MQIAVFGGGYVGLVSAACMASLGHSVLCVETDPERLSALRLGRPPFEEAGLPALLAEVTESGRLRFSDSASEAVRHGHLLFLAVGTPQSPDGSPDLRQVMDVARQIGMLADGPVRIVIKSTVPVGTSATVRALVQRLLAERGLDVPACVCFNPEFLREGTAIRDFMEPDRIVVGADCTDDLQPLRELYSPLVGAARPLLEMDLPSAEFTKYAANALLASRLSAINELSLLAEAVGADIEQVRLGAGSDARIGPHFLAPGCGYGGSCLPKDVAALLHAGAALAIELPLLQAVKAVNDRQKQLLVRRAVAYHGDLGGLRIAVWGLAFKPGTDDLREAPSLEIVTALLAEGADVVVHDPVAMPAARRVLGPRRGLSYADDPLGALEGADSLVIVTEWPQYRSIPPHQLRDRMRRPVVFDGRNCFEPLRMAAGGLHYQAIGRPLAVPPGEPSEVPVDVGLEATPRIRPAEARARRMR